MRFERSVAHLLIGLMVAFGLVLTSALYWGVIGSDEALASAFNYRQRDALAAVQRGEIVDRTGRPLVDSLAVAAGDWLRVTRDPSLPSITGYASLTYGTGGAEAAYNLILTGADQPQTFAHIFERDALHLPQRGSDIRLTLDLSIQQTAADALSGRTGAVIVMDAMTGALLAVASSPSINPATLDTDWESLIKRPDNPFFNRALQGEYQPGGALQPVLLAGWLIAGRTLDEALALSDGLVAPVVLDEVILTCVQSPAADALTPTQALLTGCPAGFEAMISVLGETATRDLLALFGATQHTELTGFSLRASSNASESVSSDWINDALGQGRLQLSPLDMAVITAAIANDGNTPQPYLLEASRTSAAAEWVLLSPPAQTLPITTAQTAQTVQSLMRQAAESGTAAGAAQTGLTLGGHVGQAVSGQKSLTWFTGFVQIEPGHSLVTVLLLEGEITPSEAAQAGGVILRAAVDANTRLNDF